MSLPTPPEGWSLGLDVSAFQGPIDAPLLLATGVSFVWVRAVWGQHPDTSWEATAHGCAGCGLPFGGYGVLVPGRGSAEEQASAFCAALEESPGWSLPPALDFELAKGWSAAEALAAAVRWRNAVEDRLGVRCAVYTGPAFFQGLVHLAAGDPAAAADVIALAISPLWVADYGPRAAAQISPLTYTPRLPSAWNECAVWQAGPAGATLPNGRPVDVDWFRGEVRELEALARR